MRAAWDENEKGGLLSGWRGQFCLSVQGEYRGTQKSVRFLSYKLVLPAIIFSMLYAPRQKRPPSGHGLPLPWPWAGYQSIADDDRLVLEA